MGAKAWFIAYYDEDPKIALSKNPKLDRKASFELANRLFPHAHLRETGNKDIWVLCPDENQVWVGCYSGLRIIAHVELGIDYPSKVDRRWLAPALGRYAYLHATHSVVDWLAFGLWQEGKLIRSLGLSPDSGIQEQLGDPLAFEKPFWDGQFPVDVDDGEHYPLPFHPLELSEASMLHHLGFQFEGNMNDWVCDPFDIPIATFTIDNPSHWEM